MGYRSSKPILWTPERVLRHDPRNDDPENWQRCVFTVPEMVFGRPITEQDVQDRAPAYRNKAGTVMERMGYQVLGLDGPHLDAGLPARAVNDPDRRQYVIWANVHRRPPEHYEVDVPDELVPVFQANGLTLKE